MGVGLLVALHAFAAHFRDASGVLIGDEPAAFKLAIENLTGAPWRLTDINSIYLFGLGLLFSLGALWKGVTFDDPYPGYGPTNRRMVSGRNAYSDQHADHFDELERIKEDAVQQLAAGIKQVPLFPQHAENVRMQRSALLESFRAYESSLEAAANQVLARYRTANRKSRKTAPPGYFDSEWKLPYRIADSTDVRNLIAEPESVPSIEPILADFRTLSDEILSEYDTLIKQFPHPTDMSDAMVSDGKAQQALKARRRFAPPNSGTDAMQALEDLASPVSTFARDECKVGHGEESLKTELYTAWRLWCERRGQPPGTDAKFGGELRSAFPSIGEKRGSINGKRVNLYTGIALVKTHNPLQF